MMMKRPDLPQADDYRNEGECGRNCMTYHSAYPNARILYADEKSFKADNRVAFFNKMKNNDYTAFIIVARPVRQDTAVARNPAGDSSGGT